MSTTTEPVATKLELDVKIDKPSTCERHIVVTVPRKEVDRYLKVAFDDLGPKAELPGFRVGKAPRKLLESKFREQISDQVKSSLVMDSLQQVTESGEFSAISEPDMDYGAVEIPKTGDFKFEFKIEVRPEFDTPNWKGLTLSRPVHTLSDKEVDAQLAKTLVRFSDGIAIDAPADLGDSLTVDITFAHDGKEIGTIEEEKVSVRKRLSFADAMLENFGETVIGAKEGDTVKTTLKIGETSTNEEYRGKTIDVAISLIEVRRQVVDELRESVLEQLGFSDPVELRAFVREELEKQLGYFQQQEIRKQVTAILTKDAQWDMPKTLVDRQTNRELQRRAMELQRSGFGNDEIRGYLNAGRRNAQEMTIAALREHFVLEKIAEDLTIEPTPEEYDAEIALIANNSGNSVRSVRARLERTGQMDTLRNQIIERRVIESIIEEAKVTDVEDASFLSGIPDDAALEYTVAPMAADIPEAKYDSKPTDGQAEGSTVKLQA